MVPVLLSTTQSAHQPRNAMLLAAIRAICFETGCAHLFPHYAAARQDYPDLPGWLAAATGHADGDHRPPRF